MEPPKIEDVPEEILTSWDAFIKRTYEKLQEKYEALWVNDIEGGKTYKSKGRHYKKGVLCELPTQPSKLNEPRRSGYRAAEYKETDKVENPYED